MRHIRTVLVLSGVLIAAVAVAIWFSRPGTSVRVMPLGDSITGSPGCWRALLWQRLRETGHADVDMVGTLSAPECGVPYDGDNEGHGGFQATEVAAQHQLVGWLAATHPDIVMMHFGTNDLLGGRSTEEILAAYTTLVDQMRASNPSMKILVAKIIPVVTPLCSDCPDRTVELDDAIPAWAASTSTAESPVTVVDQWTGWDPGSDTDDGIHPNAAGNVKMADRWYVALTAALESTAA